MTKSYISKYLSVKKTYSKKTIFMINALNIIILLFNIAILNYLKDYVALTIVSTTFGLLIVINTTTIIKIGNYHNQYLLATTSLTLTSLLESTAFYFLLFNKIDFYWYICAIILVFVLLILLFYKIAQYKIKLEMLPKKTYFLQFNYIIAGVLVLASSTGYNFPILRSVIGALVIILISVIIGAYTVTDTYVSYKIYSNNKNLNKL